MNRQAIQQILEQVESGALSPGAAFTRLKGLPYEELSFAKLDCHRALRQGLPEVIFSPGKTPGQIVKIAQRLKERNQLVMATRVEQAVADQVLPLLEGATYNELARIILWGKVRKPEPLAPQIAVVTAGTADIAVAEEAATVLKATGMNVRTIYDVGVAGLHRLLDHVQTLQSVDCIIVVAGMDAALASVVGGLVEVPVIAVPTSVGYGSSYEGLAALLSMLNSCAAGLTVVNIDNGFGAAAAAFRMFAKETALVGADQKQGCSDILSNAAVGNEPHRNFA